MGRFGISALALLAATAAPAGAVTLGAFQFKASQFGDTLVESDGGAFSSGNWLNVANSNPGNPGYLTGANFDTGIANIDGTSYTIGYSNPIENVAGVDFGVVVARYSFDPFEIEVSTDGGATFSAVLTIAAVSAVNTGVGKSYFFSGFGPFGATLWVHALDLSAFGVGLGASVDAIRVRGFTELDLIRVAGFGQDDVPMPAPAGPGLLGAGIVLLAARRRRA